jgi:chromosome partitioning protein
VLDCPPGITFASEAVFVAADALIIPTIPSTLSKRTLEQLAGFLAEQDDPPMMLPFASMADRRKTLHRTIIGDLEASTPGFLATVIPSASVVERMGLERSAVRSFAPASPAASAYRRLWADIADRLWGS